MAEKTIGVSAATAKDLAVMAKEHKVSRDVVISQMIGFFQKNGINPFEFDSPAKEMQKILKRQDDVIRFIRTQEKNILFPILKKVLSKEELEGFQESIKEELNRFHATVQMFQEQREIEEGELRQTLRNEVLSEVSKMFRALLTAEGKVRLGSSNNQALADEMKKQYEC